MRVNATLDRAEATGAEADDRVLASLQPNPEGAECDVELTIPTVSTITESPIVLFGRMVDVNNYYALVIYRAADSPDCYIIKKVAGVVTALVSGDTGIVNGDVVKFQVRNAAKKFLKNNVEILSTTDNELTAAGDAGWGLGNVRVSTDNIGSAWDVDNVSHYPVGPTTDPFPVTPNVLSKIASGTNPSVDLDWSNGTEQPMVGDLILAMVAAPSIVVDATWPDGWTLLDDTVMGTVGTTYLVSHVMAHGDPIVFEPVFTVALVNAVFQFVFIRNAHLTKPPRLSVFTGGIGSTTPDSPVLVTTDWGEVNVLWLSWLTWMRSGSIASVTAVPSNYAPSGAFAETVSGSNSLGIALAWRHNRANLENPGSFTLSASCGWSAITAAVHPSGSNNAPPASMEDSTILVRRVVDGATGLVLFVEVTNKSAPGRTITVTIEGNGASVSEDVAAGTAEAIDVSAHAIPIDEASITIS